MKITIHQPTFMPWYGFFSKLAHSDCWIVLDHTINNPRDSSSYNRRVKILVNGEAFFLSIPLVKTPTKNLLGIPINEIQINTSNKKVFKNLKKTIQMAYAKSPYFKQYFYLIEDYFDSEETSLKIRNMNFILEVMKILEINTKVIYSSSFNLTSRSNQLLVDLLKKNSATTYLCGNGAEGYQDNEFFKKNNIEIEYDHVNHPHYTQLRTSKFFSGLSILDLLFNLEKQKIIEFLACLSTPKK